MDTKNIRWKYRKTRNWTLSYLTNIRDIWMYPKSTNETKSIYPEYYHSILKEPIFQNKNILDISEIPQTAPSGTSWYIRNIQ